MTIHVKKQLVGCIHSISLAINEQIKYYHETKGCANVSELIENWFDYMPQKIVDLLENKIVNYQEARLLMEFHDIIDDVSRKLDYHAKDEDTFRNNSDWARLREKAKEIYCKLDKLGSLKNLRAN